ncbi:MAG: GNAT family N-acetyltransferase [Cyanobacteria bacterium SZAS LIN-5]|nr:GNAT family N-acetyltransferase [Cyanobacteria bacterium SZAS LIN-5]
MQIRLGNKQDEPMVRELLMKVMHEVKLERYFEQARPPLMNMEREYIGNDGTYLVAEDDRKIVGVAAAKKKSDTLCEVALLCVTSEWRRMGLGKQMLEQVVRFARGMDYDALQVDAAVVGTEAAGFLMHSGFRLMDAEESSDRRVWRMNLL